MLKNFLLLPILCLFLMLQACESSEVSMVKETAFYLDPSITWEQLFNKYKYVSDVEWSEDDYHGRPAVKAKGRYDTKCIFEMCKTNYSDEVIKEFIEELDEFPIYLTAFFKLSNDKKNFELASIQLEYEKSYEIGNTKNYLTQIAKNIPLIGILGSQPELGEEFPFPARLAITDSFVKIILQHLQYDNYKGAISYCLDYYHSSNHYDKFHNIVPDHYQSKFIIHTIENLHIGKSLKDSSIKINYAFTDIPARYPKEDNYFYDNVVDEILPNYKTLLKASSEYFYEDKRYRLSDILSGNFSIFFYNNKEEKSKRYKDKLELIISVDNESNVKPKLIMDPPKELKQAIEIEQFNQN